MTKGWCYRCRRIPYGVGHNLGYVLFAHWWVAKITTYRGNEFVQFARLRTILSIVGEILNESNGFSSLERLAGLASRPYCCQRTLPPSHIRTYQIALKDSSRRIENIYCTSYALQCGWWSAFDSENLADVIVTWWWLTTCLSLTSQQRSDIATSLPTVLL